MLRKYALVLAFVALAFSVAAIFNLGFISTPDQQPQNQPIIERTAMVNYVVDGDTIRIDDDEKVRLVGVDTPELDSSDIEEKMRAERAKEFVENLCLSDKVGLNVDDLEPRDRYGRTLAVVYVEIDNVWTNINAELLRLGFAEILYIPPSEFNPYKWMD
ncbi:MAG: thermonuclease family protein [Methanobacteriota archaeon]